MRTVLFLLALCIALLLSPAAHAQQVNRCTDAQGRTVYGDQSCETMGARARLPPDTRATGSHGLYRDSCARRLSEVVTQIRAAVDARDANRLSGIYLWNGLSNANATRVMDHLDAIVQRPLVDIAPVYPDDPALGPADVLASNDASGTIFITNMPATPPRPVALRLEQTLGNGHAPARTVLKLRRQYDCFWISL
ncbi:MAG: DUF4124 domain-containing protein [Stenotrophomonas sp.]